MIKKPRTVLECVVFFNREVSKLLMNGCKDKDLVVNMYPYHHIYKKILDGTTVDQRNKLAIRYDSFGYYHRNIRKIIRAIEEAKRIG